MTKALSRLDRLKAAAKAHAEAERAKLQAQADAGDERSSSILARIQRMHDAQLREHEQREQRRRTRQEEWQRRFQARIDQKAAQMQGRRGRLQKDDIVASAMFLLDEKGVDGVTLRDVAAQLHVQAPALYWHFANKREMVHAVAQQMLAEFVDGLETQSDEAAWRPWLRTAAHGLRSAMLAHRDGARVVAEAGLGRAPALVGFIDRTLSVLEAAGFDPVTASAGARTVLSYALGEVIEEQAGPDIDAESAELEELVSAFPNIGRAIDAQLRLSPAAQFDMGLELILRGLDTRH